MRMIKKYVKKEIYFQNKDRKLLIILGLIEKNNNGVSKKKKKFVRQYKINQPNLGQKIELE